MTGKTISGAAAYDGTAALKMTEVEVPGKKKHFPHKKRKKGRKEAAPEEKPSLAARSAQWTVPGAILAILAVALVVVLTLASYAQLVMVNDQVVDLRSDLSQLQDEETQLKAQYELAYDLKEIEQQLINSGQMMKAQSWQTYTLELAEPDAVEYYQASDFVQQVTTFAKDLVTAVKEYF